jgi:putative thioredoxin
MDVTHATFDREVLQASAGVAVLVDFWAPWCAPCRALGPVLEKLERDYAGRFKLAKVNSDENPELAARFGVRSLPTVVAFRNGQPAGSFLGALPESQVRPDEAQLTARLAADPGDLEARFALALAHAAARRYREAMDQLLSIVQKDKAWREGEARKQLLNLFTLAGDQPELVSEYRRKLATALY